MAHFTAWRQSERVAKEPFYTTIPGVNLEQLPPEKAGAVIKKLNVWRCHCGCMRSVASCRNNHKSCTESIVAAQDEANAARPVEAGLIERWRSKRNRYRSQSVCLQNLPAHGPMWDARHLVL